jgi:hypothetical protein
LRPPLPGYNRGKLQLKSISFNPLFQGISLYLHMLPVIIVKNTKTISTNLTGEMGAIRDHRWIKVPKSPIWYDRPHLSSEGQPLVELSYHFTYDTRLLRKIYDIHIRIRRVDESIINFVCTSSFLKPERGKTHILNVRRATLRT